MPRYSLEFILSTPEATPEMIKKNLLEFAQSLEVFEVPQSDAERGRNFKVQLLTEDPTVIFDICAQLGRLKSVKIDDL
jgi:dihydroxyacetone kinase-like predicted kinase